MSLCQRISIRCRLNCKCLKSRNYYWTLEPVTPPIILPRMDAPVPKLIVFDLDYTLWPFWVDTHVDPPFRKASNSKVYDAHGQVVKYYEDVPVILRNLKRQGIQLGIASRTGCIQEANDLTRLFNWDQYFDYRQVFPGSKITHFKKIHCQSGVAYQDMLFFDDEHRNIQDVSSLGVTCMFVPDGVNESAFNQGLELFKKERAKKGQGSP